MDIEFAGYAATVFSIAALLPQVWKSWKTRSTKDVSLSMFLIYATSQFLWMIYGLLIAAWPLIITNAINLFFSLVIISMKIGFDRPVIRR